MMLGFNTNEKEIEANLATLFEQHGFRYTEVSQFEEYALYVNHKNFFQAENMITFTNMDGHVFVLKPDITLSLAKNSQKDLMSSLNKLYYIDEIYRYDIECGEYKALKQIGIEVIGQSDLYVNLEIISIAMDALACISDKYALDISHSGFLSGMFQSENLSEMVCEELLESIEKKSIHDIKMILQRENVNDAFVEKMCKLIEQQTIDQKLKTIEPWIENQTMQDAYQELSAIGKMVQLLEKEEQVNLDFSASGDLEYYNGLVLSGYIDGVSKRILSGGRYDNLMRKLDNANDAFGFAMNLSQLTQNSILPKTNVDILVYYDYDAQVDPLDVFAQIKAFTDAGKSVRTEKIESMKVPIAVDYDEIYVYQDNVMKKMEGTSC